MQAITTKFTMLRSSVGHIRAITTTARRFEIFKVQSPEEFQEKVKKSDGPVIVDFFAT